MPVPDSLSDAQRDVLLLLLQDGLTYEEVADRLGIPVGNARQRALAALAAAAPTPPRGLSRLDELGDYLLGQLMPEDAQLIRERVKPDPAAVAWMRDAGESLESATQRSEMVAADSFPTETGFGLESGTARTPLTVVREDARGTETGLNQRQLAAAAINGARSVVSSRFLIEAVSLVSVVAVARLVSPSEQGHAAVGLVFPVLAYVLTFEGFGAALVQRPDPTAEHYRTAMTLSVVSALVLALVVAALAVAVGRAVFGDETARLIVLTTPSFVFAGLTAVPRARMMRQLDFRIMSRIDALQAVGVAAATVAFAAFGLGAYAIILGALAGSVIDMLLQYAYFRGARPGWSRSAAKDLFGYGSYASLTGLATTLASNIDYIVLSLFLSSRLVGIYYRSYQFGVQYQQKITVVVQKMIFPLMSRADDAGTLRRVRSRAAEMNSLTALPLLGLVIVLAPTIVPLLYGARWTAAIVPTQIMTVAGMCVVLLSTAEAPAMALGKTTRIFVVSATFLVVYGASLAVMARYGLIVACVTSATVHVAFMFISQRYLVDKILNLPASQFWLDTGPAIVSTLISMAAAGFVRSVLHAEITPIVLSVICLVVGFSVYGATLRLLFPARARRIGTVLRGVIRPGARLGSAA